MDMTAWWMAPDWAIALAGWGSVLWVIGLGGKLVAGFWRNL